MTMPAQVPVFDEALINLAPPQVTTKAELFNGMVGVLVEHDRVADAAAFLGALDDRESLGSTYMGNSIALPHGKSASVRHPSVCAWRLQTPLTYESNDEVGKVTRVFMLAMPESADGEHLRTLAAVARLLAHEEVLTQFDDAEDPATVVELLSRNFE